MNMSCKYLQVLNIPKVCCFRNVLFLLLALDWYRPASAQLLNLNRFFAPGLNLHAEWIPVSQLADTSQFGVNRYNLQLIVPLKGDLSVKLRKPDLKVRQTFLAINAGFRQPSITTASPLMATKNNIYTLSGALTGISASFRDKIWLWSIGGGFTESDNTFSHLKPYGLATVLRIRIKNLKTQYFYGGAISYTPSFLLPVPIAGLTTKLSSQDRLTLIFPVQANLNHSFSETFNTDIALGFGGFNSGYQTPIFGSNPIRLNYRQIKLSAQANYNPTKRVQFSLELGIAAARNLTAKFGNTTLRDFTPKAQPFVGLNLYINLKGSILESRGFGNDL